MRLSVPSRHSARCRTSVEGRVVAHGGARRSEWGSTVPGLTRARRNRRRRWRRSVRPSNQRPRRPRRRSGRWTARSRIGHRRPGPQVPVVGHAHEVGGDLVARHGQATERSSRCRVLGDGSEQDREVDLAVAGRRRAVQVWRDPPHLSPIVLSPTRLSGRINTGCASGNLTNTALSWSLMNGGHEPLRTADDPRRGEVRAARDTPRAPRRCRSGARR